MRATALNRRSALQLAAATACALLPLSVGAAEAGPVAVVQGFSDALRRAAAATPTTPFGRRFDALGPAVDRAFDLATILRVSIGPRWTSIPADEQGRLTIAFRRYTIANFAANFHDDPAMRISVDASPRAAPGGDQVVSTQLLPTTGSPATLAYVMRQTEAGWRCVDVLADGTISRVATQRSDFRGVLNSGGGAGLIASLESKVVALSDGSVA